MTRPARLTTFLFDLDGTLIDSIDLILTCYRHTAWKHLGSVPPDSVWLEGLGTPLRDQMASLASDPTQLEAMVATYREIHRQNHDRLLKRYPGVVDAVQRLKRAGAGLGVVTSKMRWSTHRGLEICGFDGLFDVLVTAEDVDKHKPSPEPVLKALELLTAAHQETVFVGDSPHDMAAGRAAGVRTAAVLWGPFSRESLAPCRPDFWLTEPSEIPGLLRNAHSS